MQPLTKRAFTIWSFIGYLFIIYGVVISAAGIYYLRWPDQSVLLYALNPSLWWGLVLLGVGLIFAWVGRRPG